MNNFIRATSTEKNEQDAVDEVAKKLEASSAAFSVLFISHQYDINKIQEAVKSRFSEKAIACTTAGEIATDQYSEYSISGVSFQGDDFLFEKVSIDDLNDLNPEMMKSSMEKVKQNEAKLGVLAKTFGIILIDGLSVKEEIVCGFISNFIGDIPLVGGSAGDGLNFGHTYIYSGDQFKENSATVLFVTTDIPFQVFKSQHFDETDRKVVITESIPEKRIVTEINGEPAATAYADLLDIEIKDFSPTVFSNYPLMLKVGGEFFVRSIQKVNDDLSLTFYCAIDTGLVLTLAKKKNFFENTSRLFNDIKDNKLGNLECSILFECILRRLEVEQMQDYQKDSLFELYRENNCIGFHTYGEQFGNVHINHTLIGVVFGKKR